MPVYDWNGTTSTPIKEIYDWNGSASTEIGEAYDWNGSASTTIYFSTDPVAAAPSVKVPNQ